MHRKKLCSSEMTAYAAMCMVGEMANACLCKGFKDYSLLNDLIDTFENGIVAGNFLESYVSNRKY